MYQGGDGSITYPYLIATPQDLDDVRLNLTAHFAMISDVDLSGWSPWVPINGFDGGFDGRGHVITNLEIPAFDYANDARAGVFGTQINKDTGSYIKRLGVATTDTGVVGTSTERYDSVLVGRTTGLVEDCWVEGVLNPFGERGGAITGFIIDHGDAGAPTIRRCWAAVRIDGALGPRVGAMIAQDGFFDTTNRPDVHNNYFDYQVATTSQLGLHVQTAETTPKTTAQMKAQATFSTFDFDDVWTIDEGNDYPRLRVVTVPSQYDDETSSISRSPVGFIRMTLDACDNVFSVPPCTATGPPGSECYNTFFTCQDKPNFVKTTKVYTFSSARGAEVEARPYLSDIRWMPTEIKPGKITVKGRITLSLDDEPDTDRGIDPYVDTRSSIQGTFWKKLLARNPNFKGRVIEVFRGYDGLSFGDYELRWAGLIDTITLDDSEVKIEVADELISLDKIEMPPKLDIELPADIIASATSITTSDSDDLPTAGYAKIGDEAISWTSKNDSTNIISGVTRGALGTTAEAHTAGTRFDLCVYYDGTNPFDIMEGLLTNSIDIEVDNPPGAGLDSARVDSAAFSAAKEFPGDEPLFSTLLFKPAKISKLLFEIADLCDCSVWMNEEQKITIRRNNIPNAGGRTYTTITDDANIEKASADLNEESRNSRISIYWDRDIFGDEKKTEDYNAINIAIDVSAESENEYNGIEERKIATRWLRKTWGAYEREGAVDRFVSNLSSRLLVNSRDAQPIIHMALELKDEGIQSGDYVRISTDELQNVDGTDISDKIFSIWKRDHKGETLMFSSVGIRSNKIGIIAPNSTPDFTSATVAQKEYGFISDDDGLMSDGSQGSRIY